MKPSGNGTAGTGCSDAGGLQGRAEGAAVTNLSGFPGKAGIAGGDFHSILEIPFRACEDIFIQEGQWPCCSCENQNDLHSAKSRELM